MSHLRKRQIHLSVLGFIVTLHLLLVGPVAAEQDSGERALYDKAQALMDARTTDLDALPKARKLIKELQASYPKSPLVYVAAGRYSYLAGYLHDDKYRPESLRWAHRAFAKAITLDPQLFDAYYYGTYAFIFDKDYEHAAALAAQAEKLSNDSVRTDLLLASVAALKKDDREVEQRAQRVLDRTSETRLKGQADYLLIGVYRRQGRHELADQAYNRVLAREPNSPTDNINYSSFLVGRHEYDKAIDYAKRALAITDFGIGHVVLASALYGKGSELYKDKTQLREAQKAFAQAVDENPKDADAQYSLGLTLYKIGHASKDVAALKQAEAALNDALQLNPEHKQARAAMDQLQKLFAWLKQNNIGEAAGAKQQN